MKEVRSLEALKKEIQSRINDALLNEISETIAKVESEVIKDNVYGQYLPRMYDRRGLEGGLGDPDNIKGRLLSNGVLIVENLAEFDQRYKTDNQGTGLAGLVEYGDGHNGHYYDYRPSKGDAAYLKPRLFIQETQEHVDRLVIDDIAMALEDRGLKVRKL